MWRALWIKSPSAAATISIDTQPWHNTRPACYLSSLLAAFWVCKLRALSWGWEGPYVSGSRSLVLISDRSTTLDAFLNLLNPSTGPTFICCRSITFGRNAQTKALNMHSHLSGIALVRSGLRSLQKLRVVFLLLLMLKASGSQPLLAYSLARDGSFTLALPLSN